MESVHRELAATVQLGQSSTMVGAPSGGALAPRTALMVAVLAGTLPPSGESMRETPIRRLDSGSGYGKWGSVWGQPLFIRGLQPTRSQGGLRPNLGLNRLEIVILEI
jgi:hypothetical protein